LANRSLPLFIRPPDDRFSQCGPLLRRQMAGVARKRLKTIVEHVVLLFRWFTRRNKSHKMNNYDVIDL
jgi:hypothetical protein